MRRWSVGDVMTGKVFSVGASTPYKQIVASLQRHRVSAVPVVDEHHHVIGVVSEADLLPKLERPDDPPMFDRKQRRQARAKAEGDVASELMSAPPVTISPQAAISAAARLMDSERVKRLPVVDDQGRLVGIVSRADLLRPFLRTDDEIRQDIRDQVLLRTLWIDPDTLDVAVDGGVVTLTGTADRLSTADIIVRMCRGVAGVVEVVNEIVADRDDTAELNRHNPMGATVKVMTP
jgi:CBS-domain-containing membrane protein